MCHAVPLMISLLHNHYICVPKDGSVSSDASVPNDTSVDDHKKCCQYSLLFIYILGLISKLGYRCNNY